MKKTYLLLLCVSSFFVACEKDEIISEQETTLAIEQSIEKINFKDLPSNVSKYFEEKKNLGNLKSKAGNPFGKAKKNQPVIKITNKNRVVSYTIALTKRENSINKGRSHLYFDNLVVKELPDGGEKALVFRYEPDQTWYSNSARSLKTYTGNIKVFDWQSNAMGNMKVVEGKLVKEKNHNKRSTTVECIYELDYIFCVGGGGDFPTETCTYYYKEKCTLTDGGDGGDPGPGAPGGSTGGSDWGDGSSPPTGGGNTGSGDEDGVDTQPLLWEDDCNTSVKDMKAALPNASDDVLEEITNLVNKFGADFGIDTKEELQHFLAQAGHESNSFLALEEDVEYYRVSRLNEIWPNYFNPEGDPDANINKRNPNDFANSGGTFAEPEKLLNLVYEENKWLGNSNDGDGYKYRGRGIFQLTGRFNYSAFNKFYQLNYDSTIDVLQNPNLLSSNLRIAVISALWFYKNNVMNEINIDSETTVEEITLEVNGGQNGIKDRKAKFERIKLNIDCLEL